MLLCICVQMFLIFRKWRSGAKSGSAGQFWVISHVYEKVIPGDPTFYIIYRILFCCSINVLKSWLTFCLFLLKMFSRGFYVMFVISSNPLYIWKERENLELVRGFGDSKVVLYSLQIVQSCNKRGILMRKWFWITCCVLKLVEANQGGPLGRWNRIK